jgi:hypothetical protein
VCIGVTVKYMCCTCKRVCAVWHAAAAVMCHCMQVRLHASSDGQVSTSNCCVVTFYC